MILRLSPKHGVEVEAVAGVTLTEDADGEYVCRIYWHSGNCWEIKGQYATCAWIGWMSFWKKEKKVEVKVPGAIIEKMQRRATVHVTEQEESM
jgi:hypothetical protein